MSERSRTIFRLCSDLNSRTSYIRAKLSVLVPSQIKALRFKSAMPRQADLAREAEMHQSRISMFETPGEANMTLETLSRLAAAFKVGLVVKFVPFSEMLRWENNYSQDAFEVTKIDDDLAFVRPESETPLLDLPNNGDNARLFSFSKIGGEGIKKDFDEGEEAAANAQDFQAKAEEMSGLALAARGGQ